MNISENNTPAAYGSISFMNCVSYFYFPTHNKQTEIIFYFQHNQPDDNFSFLSFFQTNSME